MLNITKTYDSKPNALQKTEDLQLREVQVVGYPANRYGLTTAGSQNSITVEPVKLPEAGNKNNITIKAVKLEEVKPANQ